MMRLYKHRLYWSYTGDNQNQTITLMYYVVDDFGSLVEIARLIKPWENKNDSHL